MRCTRWHCAERGSNLQKVIIRPIARVAQAGIGLSAGRGGGSAKSFLELKKRLRRFILIFFRKNKDAGNPSEGFWNLQFVCGRRTNQSSKQVPLVSSTIPSLRSSIGFQKLNDQ